MTNARASRGIGRTASNEAINNIINELHSKESSIKTTRAETYASRADNKKINIIIDENVEYAITKMTVIGKQDDVGYIYKVSAAPKYSEDYMKLKNFVYKKDFDSFNDKRIHRNIIAKNWPKLKSLLKYYKSYDPNGKTELMNTNFQGSINDSLSSANITENNIVYGHLRKEIQVPTSVKIPNIRLNNKITLNQYTIEQIGDNVLNGINPIYSGNIKQNAFIQYTTNVQDVNAKIADPDAFLRDRQELMIDANIIKGGFCDLSVSNLNELDSFAASMGKSVANMFGSTMIMSNVSMSTGNIDRDVTENISAAAVNGKITMSKFGV